ncbi:MAG TPA: hypothetical protein VNJ46_03700 [Gaiellaceae bacterium]|nr:hypothetical protein [Gaiellaceae bacterium]
MSRSARAAAALLCLVLGASLVALALDAGRWREALREGDLRYAADPERASWEPARQVVPGALVPALLGVDDDIAYRLALRAVRLSRPESVGLSDPELVVRRNEAIARLTEILQGDGPARRRSAAANLLGVLSFSDSLYDYENRGRLLATATSRFREAIELDPGNDEAKHNLELALQRTEEVQFAESGGGTNPIRGGRGAKGAGATEPGGGY